MLLWLDGTLGVVVTLARVHLPLVFAPVFTFFSLLIVTTNNALGYCCCGHGLIIVVEQVACKGWSLLPPMPPNARNVDNKCPARSSFRGGLLLLLPLLSYHLCCHHLIIITFVIDDNSSVSVGFSGWELCAQQCVRA
jgi:hypothetical protein